jgi:hypothetical protein
MVDKNSVADIAEIVKERGERHGLLCEKNFLSLIIPFFEAFCYRKIKFF